MHAAHSTRPAVTWPTAGLSFGGDYNPDQWSPATWDEDIALMQQAKVNIVSLGIFSWSKLEPRDGEFDWLWLDTLLDKLHAAGISVDLATPTASAPPWLLHAEPSITPLDQNMRPRHPGTRLGWCPSSPVFRQYAVRIAGELSKRYAAHPAVKMWHVSNELGGGNARCYCDISAEAFRTWLRRRYQNIDTLNRTWGTAFWGHLYSDFAEVLPPRDHEQANNPGLYLDYQRFSSDELLDHFLAEKAAINEFSQAPVTTNLMVAASGTVAAYETWAPHLDIVSNDHYTIVDDPDRPVELSLSGDRMRGLTGNTQPWLLMEHSTGAPAWQQVNRAKLPGEIIRNAISHVARGSDSAMFFQWRASTAGAEQFHSAMLPHTGAQSRVFKEITTLGNALHNLGELQGSLLEPAEVAVVLDSESSWVYEHGLKPHRALKYTTEPRKWYLPLWCQQITADVVHAGSDLSQYKLVIVPSMMVMSQEFADKLEQYVSAGGTAVVTFLSGIVDENQRVIAGGYPGALRDMLGVFSEEFRPLQEYESVTLSDGSAVRNWTEDTVLVDAKAVLTYDSGPNTGRAAVTRRELGSGSAWYVAAELDQQTVNTLVAQLVEQTGLQRVIDAPAGVEATRRVNTEGAAYLFLINHTSKDATVAVAGEELLSGTHCESEFTLEAGGVAVIRERQ